MQAFRGRLPRIAVSGAVVATCLMAGGTAASAQVAPPFAELFRQTSEAPRQLELEAEVDRAEGLARQARAYPNPTVSVMTENVGGQRPYNRFGRAENTLQVNQPLELFGKRSARIASTLR